jgi:NADH-quinone oxidoreductase subunit M
MGSILSLVTFLPLIGAVVLLVFLRGEDAAAQQNAKMLAFFTTVATFVLSLVVMFGFDPADAGFQFVEERPWIGGLTYKMGVDGISVLFVMLTTFLMPLCIAASWRVSVRVREYMVAFLVLETLMLTRISRSSSMVTSRSSTRWTTRCSTAQASSRNSASRPSR